MRNTSVDGSDPRGRCMRIRTVGIFLLSHHLQGPLKVRFDSEASKVTRRLFDPLDLTADAPLLPLVESALHNTDHGLVEAIVKVLPGIHVLNVRTVQAAVRIEIPSQLEDQVEGFGAARGKRGEAVDVWEEFEHRGGKMGRWKGGVQVVLEAVEVKVHNGYLSVELSAEGVGGRGCVRGGAGVGIHCFCYVCGNVCSGGVLATRWVQVRIASRADTKVKTQQEQKRKRKEGNLTRPQASLVNPLKHFGALLLELLHIDSQICNLGLQVFDLLNVRSQCGVEGLLQQIRRLLHLAGSGSGSKTSHGTTARPCRGSACAGSSHGTTAGISSACAGSGTDGTYAVGRLLLGHARTSILLDILGAVRSRIHIVASRAEAAIVL
jgi:hypothetical protein